VELRPFRGLRYNPAAIDDLFAVLAPPYDVISPQERERYHQQHAYNVVRLIFGRDEAGDTSDTNRYTRAAEYLRTWLQTGVLTRDTRPSMYVCAEEYLLPDGIQRERTGLIALCRLEPFDRGIVLPHEETSPVPKQMLFALRATIQANLSQIFALYADETGTIRDILETQCHHPPGQSFRDGEGMRHRIWTIDEAPRMQAIQGRMADRWALIADGHHRYETGLAYQHHARQQLGTGTGEEWFNFVMLYLTDIHDPGLTILPTHRVVRGLSPQFIPHLPAAVRGPWQVETFACAPHTERETLRRGFMQELRLRGEGARVIGLYRGDDRCWFLTYTGAPGDGVAAGAARPIPGQTLDVTLLHDLLLKDLLGAEVQEDAIAFTQDASTAMDLVAGGAFQLAFLVNATRVEQVVEHALAGVRLPRKSTYFYPKLLTGTVIHQEVGDAESVG
jgi:uncharacterized protein (DUF1015 family)